MRREARTENQIELPRLARYHGSKFQTLGFYNSDRFVKVTPDYKVSTDNTPSTLKIIKAGSEVGGIGIEWEVCCDDLPHNEYGRLENPVFLANILTMINKNVFPEDLFRMEEDCTVDAEMVSQVMSKSFIRNNYRNFKSAFNTYFPSFGINCANGKCGMHVNISLSLFGKDRATQIDNVRKLGYIINANYDFFKVAFHRVGSTHWCPRMNSSLEYWRDTELYNFPISHDECCINMGHVSEGRVEIRLVGGQKNFACFRNTMETIFFLIDRVKKIKWSECNDLSKVFIGCNSYVYNRISTNCYRANTISHEALEKIYPTVKEEEFL